MIAAVRSRGRSGRLFAALLISLSGLAASFASTFLSGTKTGAALALAAVGGPTLLYLAVAAPIVFPFCLYALLVPFDNLLSLAAFGTLTRFLGAASGAALVIFMLRTRRFVRPSKTLLIWCALICWMIATTFWALDQSTVLLLIPTAVQLLALYAAVSFFRSDRATVHWVALAIIAGGTSAAAYGAYLFASGTDLAGNGSRLWIASNDSAIDPNHFGAALLLPLALAGMLALRSRVLWQSIAALAALAIMLVALGESGSRGAALGLAAMLAYVFIRGDHRRRLLLFTVPSAALIAALTAHASIWARFSDSLASGGSNRVAIWDTGLRALKAHWLAGAGYNDFPFAYDQALLQAHQIEFASWHRAPHNLLLGTTVELGVVGLALLLAGWIAQFRLVRCVASTEPGYTYRLAAEAAIIGTFVAALFLDVMISKYVWLTFMFAALLRNAHKGA